MCIRDRNPAVRAFLNIKSMNKSEDADPKLQALDKIMQEKTRFNGNYESWFLTEEEEIKKQVQ